MLGVHYDPGLQKTGIFVVTFRKIKSRTSVRAHWKRLVKAIMKKSKILNFGGLGPNLAGISIFGHITAKSLNRA